MNFDGDPALAAASNAAGQKQMLAAGPTRRKVGMKYVAGMTPGSSVNLEIWRNHGAKNLTVTLGALEDKRTAASGAPREQGGKLGLAVRPLSPEEQRQSNTKGGLVVERATGPAAEAGIQPGDVVLAANGATVNNADELKSAVEKSKGHIALLIQRGEARIFVPVRVG